MFGSGFGQQAQQQPQQTGGLFSNTANNTQQSSGLFGSNTNNTQQTGGLFGNTNTNNTQQTGGLFGNTNANNNTTATNSQQSGGLFGNTASNQQTGGLFGGTNNNQQTGGLFSSANNNQQQQQQQQPQQSGLFSNNGCINTTQQPTFSWSKPSDQASTNNSLSLQSNNNSANGAGAATTQPLFNNMAANSNAAPLAVTLFQKQQQQTSGPLVIDQIEKIKDSWDPTSPQCALQYFFYNKVGTQQALLYQKPAGIEQARWDAAMAARPDDAHVPVHVVGFADLEKRVARQEATVLVYRQRMHEINDKLNQLSSRHDLHTLVKTAQMQARHQRLIQRTLALAARLQVLRQRGFVLKPDEEVLKRELERLNQQVDDPAVFGRINEIWARLTVLRERAQALNQRVDEHDQLSSVVAAASKSSLGSSSLDWNDEQLEKLAKVLKAQQVGIAYLADVLQTDTAKVESIIDKQLQQQRQPSKRRW